MEEPILKSKPSYFSSHGMASFNTAMVSLAMQNKKKGVGAQRSRVFNSRTLQVSIA